MTPDFLPAFPTVLVADADPRLLEQLRYALEALEPRLRIALAPNAATMLQQAQQHHAQHRPVGLVLLSALFDGRPAPHWLDALQPWLQPHHQVLLLTQGLPTERASVLQAHLQHAVFASLQRNLLFHHLPAALDQALQRLNGNSQAQWPPHATHEAYALLRFA